MVVDLDIEHAARLLGAARRDRASLVNLPAGVMPASIAEAHKIQDALTRVLSEEVKGYKVAAVPGEAVMRGALLGSRVFASPALVDPCSIASVRVEVEIAFRLLKALPPRVEPYQRAEVLPLLQACPAIEMIGTRYADVRSISRLEHIADHLGNDAFVHGVFAADWHQLDMLHIQVTLDVDGERVVEAFGGHMTGDPMAPVVALANHFRTSTGLEEGVIVTTGSFTGSTPVKPGQKVVATIAGLGRVEMMVAGSH